VLGSAPASDSGAWTSLIGALGLDDATVGQPWNTKAGVPPLAGCVETAGERGHPHAVLLRLVEPAPGIVSMFAHPVGGQLLLVIDFYLYGDRAAAAVHRDEPVWHAWMNEQFPSVGDANTLA
jgi:hypothetical protein